jgi:ATP-dependent DNA helicase RecG
VTPLRLFFQSSTDSVAQARALIRQGEGQCTEFKISFQKEVIASLVAFANTKGGLVLVGVSDASQVVGTEIKAETLQAWINQCKQNTSPSVIPDIEVLEIDGKTIAIIALTIPHQAVAYKGRYFKRIGNANHQMTPTEISDAHIKLINSLGLPSRPDSRIDTISP